MSEWGSFTKPAQVGSNDFGDDERLVVRDGKYHARCIRIGEPYDKANPQSGEMQTKFCAEWELTNPRNGKVLGALPSFITLPPKFLDEGFLSEKANLYKVMKALGYDMTGRFNVNPPEWAEKSLALDVVVENSDGRDNDGNPTQTSWITKFLPCSCEDDDEEPAPKPKREPVGAGAGKGRAPLRQQVDVWAEDDD